MLAHGLSGYQSMVEEAWQQRWSTHGGMGL